MEGSWLLVLHVFASQTSHEENGWIEGAAILIAVFLVAFVTASNDYSKQLMFQVGHLLTHHAASLEKLVLYAHHLVHDDMKARILGVSSGFGAQELCARTVPRAS